MKSVPWIIISVLIALLFLQRECTHCPECPECPEVDTSSTVRIDSIGYPVIAYRPMADLKWNFTFDFTKPMTRSDSAAAVQDYLLKYYLRDTLIFDTNAIMILEDSINMNRVIWRKPTFTLFPRTVTNTQIVTKQADPLRKMFVGVGIGRSKNQFGLSPTLMYLSKKDHAYSLSYDILNHDIYFTMYYKINFNRHE